MALRKHPKKSFSSIFKVWLCVINGVHNPYKNRFFDLLSHR